MGKVKFQITKSADVLVVQMMEDETDDGKDNGIERNLGTQPLDAIMVQHGLTNNDLTEATNVQLTHKAVQRARKGRRLTLHLQRRIIETLNAALRKRKIDVSYAKADLFTY